MCPLALCDAPQFPLPMAVVHMTLLIAAAALSVVDRKISCIYAHLCVRAAPARLCIIPTNKH